MQCVTSTNGPARWLLGLGVAAATVVLGVAPGSDERRRSVAYWVADRDGGAVVGLDRDLLTACRFELAWPVRVAARPDGGVVAVSAAAGDPDGYHRIVAFEPGGRGPERPGPEWHTSGPVIDLALAGEHAVAVVQGRSGRRLIELSETRWFGIERARAADPTRCAFSGERLLVGTEHGSIHAFDEAAGVELVVRPAERIEDLEPGPQPGSAWVLDGGERPRLMLLGSDLVPRWSVLLAGGSARPATLVPVPSQERVWLIAPGADRLSCFGPGGTQEREVEIDSAGGLGRGVADESGGLVLAAAGTVIRLRANGERRPGQGGFDFAVDVCRARRGPGPVSSP